MKRTILLLAISLVLTSLLVGQRRVQRHAAQHGLGSPDVLSTLPVGIGGTGTATVFTQGSMVFAGASGVYTQDNANLFWDAALNKLVIGKNNSNAVLSLISPDSTDVAFDTAVLGAIFIGPPPTTSTRNFTAGMHIVTKSNIIDKGRGIIIDHQLSISDAIWVNNIFGGSGIAVTTTDQGTPTNNSFGFIGSVNSNTSIGLLLFDKTDGSVNPILMELKQNATTANNSGTFRLQFIGNAAHKGFRVVNTGGHASSLAFVASDSSSVDQFTVRAEDGFTTIGNVAITHPLRVGGNTAGEAVLIDNNTYYAAENSAGTDIRLIGISGDDIFLGAVDNATGSVTIREDGVDALVIAAGNVTVPNGLYLPRRSATEPVSCASGVYGSQYYDTDDDELCTCRADGTDNEWVKQTDPTHTGHCSIT